MDEEIQHKLGLYGILVITSAFIGASVGCGLSFTTLSPLVIGGIIGSIFPLPFMVCVAGESLHNFCKGNKNKAFCKNSMVWSGATAIGAATGVGLSAAMNFCSLAKCQRRYQ